MYSFRNSAEGVAVDSSDNVYLTGTSETAYTGTEDMVLVKYDSSGVQQWNRTWGGNDIDYSKGVAVDSSDNVYIAGSTDSFGGGSGDMALVKYNSSGAQQWNCTWGGIEGEWASGVALDSFDNVYIVGGTSGFGAGGTDMVLVKYDSSGAQQWNRTWGGPQTDFGSGVAMDSSDNIYITGYTPDFTGDSDMVLVKYDSFGVQQWNRTWGGVAHDLSWGVAVDSSDDVYIVGDTESFGDGGFIVALVKYNSFGVQQWNRTWDDLTQVTGVTVDSSNHVYVVGTRAYSLVDFDMAFVKCDSSGVRQWNRTWSGLSHGEGVAVDSSENVYLVGTLSYDLVLVKYGLGENGEEKEEEPIIFGYNLLLLISVIGVVAIVISFKIKRKLT